MNDKENLQLAELDSDRSGGGDFKGAMNAKDLEAVYDVPVQISAVLGRATMQVSQLLKLGRARGAKVTHDDHLERALAGLRAGKGAELVMMDVKLDIRRMVDSLKQERINIPVVACGIGTDAE